MCVFTVELEVCDGFDNEKYTSASYATILILRSCSFLSSPSHSQRQRYITFPICSMSTEHYQVVKMCGVPANCASCHCGMCAILLFRMHPSVAIEMWIGIQGRRKEKPKTVVASWLGNTPRHRVWQSLVSDHHWWGVHHFGCHGP